MYPFTGAVVKNVVIVRVTRYAIPLVFVFALCDFALSTQDEEYRQQDFELVFEGISSMNSEDYKSAQISSVQEYLPELHAQLSSSDWNNLSVWDRHTSISHQVLVAWGDSDADERTQQLKSFERSLTQQQRGILSAGVASISDTLLFHFVLGKDMEKTNRMVVEKISGVLKQFYPDKLESFDGCTTDANNKSNAKGVEVYSHFLEGVGQIAPNVDLAEHVTELEEDLTGELVSVANQLGEDYSQCLQATRPSPKEEM